MNEKRLKAELRVYYGTSHEVMLSGYSADLSSGGLFIASTVLLDIDKSLVLKISLPDATDAQVVTCRGRVAWINDENNPQKPGMPTGMGVEFVDLEAENLASIASFLEIEATW